MTIDPASGVATAVGPTEAGALPGLAVSPSGELFATTSDPSDLYRLDAATGLGFRVGSTGLSYMDALAFDRDGNLWGTAGDGLTTLYRIDTSTGAATAVGPDNENIRGLAFDPTDGTLYGSTGGSGGAVSDAIYTVDTSTGTVTLVGQTGLGGAIPDIAFDVNGGLYGVKGGGNGGTPPPSNLIAIDKTTGAGTLIGPTGIDGISGLGSQAFLHRVTEHVIYGTQGLAGDLLLTIDPATGAGTPVGHTGISLLPGLAISPSGDMYGVRGGRISNDLFRIDPVTAEAFFVGHTGGVGFDSITFGDDGTLWGIAGLGTKTLYRIDPATADLTAVGDTGEQLAGLAVDPTDGTMYASTGGSSPTNPSSIYEVNTATAALSLIGSLGIVNASGGIPDITFDAAGQMYGVIGSGGGGGGSTDSDFITIDKTTGAGVVVGSVGTVGVSGLDEWAYGAALDAPRAARPVGRTLLEAARPNPFGATTELRFGLGRTSPVKIDVFSVTGQRIVRLVDGPFEAGEHLVRWNGLDAGGRPVADGIYYVRMRAGDVDQAEAVVRIN